MHQIHLTLKIDAPDYLSAGRAAEMINKTLRNAVDEARETLRSGDDDDDIENATLVNACRFHEVSTLP
jgi:hypothetical protein